MAQINRSDTTYLSTLQELLIGFEQALELVTSLGGSVISRSDEVHAFLASPDDIADWNSNDELTFRGATVQTAKGQRICICVSDNGKMDPALLAKLGMSVADYSKADMTPSIIALFEELDRGPIAFSVPDTLKIIRDN